MIKNKTWQHEETGRITTCAIRPGNRWYEVDIAMDCEHEDLTGKTYADKLIRRSPEMTKNETMQKLIAMLRKDAYEATTLVKHYADENKQLRAFAQAIMESWPEGGIEGDDLQEIALKHGMLAPEIRHEPCGEWCQCNGIGGYDSDGWQRGVTCYRRTALLTGEVE